MFFFFDKLRYDSTYQKIIGVKNAGFTLIELLVVILIIGILAAVALPQYKRAVEKSRAMQVMLTGRHVVKMQELYYLANGKYASGWEELGEEKPELKDFRVGAQWQESYSPFSISFDRLNYSPTLRFVFFQQNLVSYYSQYAGRSFCVAHSSDKNGKSFCKSLSNSEGEAYQFLSGWISFELN